MSKINEELLTALFNSFYSRRFSYVGETVAMLSKKGIETGYIGKTLFKMTVFGFFISSYPTLIKTMEGIEEYDLISRAKMLEILKKTTPVRTKKRTDKEVNELATSHAKFRHDAMYRSILKNGSKSNSVSIFGV